MITKSDNRAAIYHEYGYRPNWTTQSPIREGTFFIGGRGWAGALEGRVISKYFTNWRGSNLFDRQPGESHSFIWRGKYYSMSVS